MRMLQAGIFLSIFYADQAIAVESEALAERDLTVKETFDSLSGTEKVEIGEVEKETEHDAFSQRETHEGLHETRESHDSIRESVHESSDLATEHESGSGTREPIERP